MFQSITIPLFLLGRITNLILKPFVFKHTMRDVINFFHIQDAKKTRPYFLNENLAQSYKT